MAQIYRGALQSWMCIIITLIFIGASIGVLTWLGMQSPQIISNSQFIQDTGFGQQLKRSNLYQYNQATQFQELMSQGLIGYFCQDQTRQFTKPYGIQLVVISDEEKERLNVTYSIGSIRQTPNSCFQIASRFTSINYFPVLTQGQEIDILQQRKTQEITFQCYLTNKWTCKSQQILYQDSENYQSLFAFLIIANETSQDKQWGFVIVNYEEKYFLYNQVMYIIWLGISMVLGCFVYLFDARINDTKIPTMIYRGQLMIIFAINSHPFLLFQMIHDHIIFRIMNIVCTCLAQSGFLYYHLIIMINLLQFRRRPSQLVALIICLLNVTQQTLIVLYKVLSLVDLPENVFYLDSNGFSYFGLWSVILFALMMGLPIYQFFLIQHQSEISLEKAQNIDQLKQKTLYFKGLSIYNLSYFLFIGAYFARIIWQYYFYFDIQKLYFDHYQACLINLSIIYMFIMFDPDIDEEFKKFDFKLKEVEMEEMASQQFEDDNEEDEIKVDEGRKAIGSQSRRELHTQQRVDSYNDRILPGSKDDD
ncbi:hypothetical protein pb186bvf_006747 [Paramecium bursaria]